MEVRVHVWYVPAGFPYHRANNNGKICALWNLHVYTRAVRKL